jgi:hypothetical protein
MSRTSHAARLERLKRQLQDRPAIRIVVEPWMLELAKRVRQRASAEAATPREPRRAESTESER